MGSGDEALELPEGVELKIKNEDFLFVEWRDNKFHKNEKETNCNVVQLLYDSIEHLSGDLTGLTRPTP